MGYLFLHVGKDYLSTFNPIADSVGEAKPHGGKWFTKYDLKYPNYNEWVDFLIEHPNMIFYKHLDPQNMPCVIIKLKETAKIFNLTSVDELYSLIEQYPDKDGFFSYELLSQDYDGIFVNPRTVLNNLNDETLKKRIALYDVPSLLLFNDREIEYYQSGFINILNIDIDDENYSPYEVNYKINIDHELKYIDDQIKR